MINEILIKVGIAAGLMLAACGLTYKYTANYYEAKIDALHAAAVAQAQIVKQENAHQLQIAKETQDDLQNQLAKIPAAVTVYRDRYRVQPCAASSSTVPGQADGAKSPDAAGSEQLVTDDTFIKACAADAARLNTWIEFATVSGFRVE